MPRARRLGTTCAPVLRIALRGAGPEPQTGIRSAEQVDLVRTQFEASETELRQRLHPIDNELDPQVFIGEQLSITIPTVCCDMTLPLSELHRNGATLTPAWRKCFRTNDG